MDSKPKPCEHPATNCELRDGRTEESGDGCKLGAELKSQICTDYYPNSPDGTDTAVKQSQATKTGGELPDLSQTKSQEFLDTGVQATTFISDSVKVLKNYVNKSGIEAPYYNREELRQSMRTIAIVLTNAHPEFKATILKLLSESNEFLSLLALFIQQQFNGK